MKTKVICFALFIFTIYISKAQEKPALVGSILRTHAQIYGDMFEGRKTASGEVFNNDSLTCSHRTLPFNTMLFITNAVNGKTVTLRVNDRGLNPNSSDLYVTRDAAIKLGLPRQGGTKITMQIIGQNGIVMQEDEKPMTYEAEVLRENNLKNQKYNKHISAKTEEKKYNFEIKPFEDENNDLNTNLTYTLDGTKARPEGFGIQLFSVDNLKMAQDISKNLVEENINTQIFIQQMWVKGKKVFRVIAGEYNIEEAKAQLHKFKKAGHKGFVQKHISA